MRPLLLLLYFFTGFFVGVFATMLLAILCQPLVMIFGGYGRIVATFAPLIIGSIGGLRCAHGGYTHGASLGSALRFAFLLGSLKQLRK